MGFRKDAYATCWSVEPKSDTMTIVRLSINSKNKQTNSYEQDFGDFVAFIGTAVAKKAANLKEKDRIKLGDVDVTNKYNQEKHTTYYSFKCFGFEKLDDKHQSPKGTNESDPVEDVVEDLASENKKLPF